MTFYSPVLKFYYSNGQLKKEIFISGIIPSIKDLGLLKIIKEFLASTLRFKSPICFKSQNSDVLSISYGIQSVNQKSITHYKKENIEYFVKKPIVESALKALMIEQNAIKMFNTMSIMTMQSYKEGPEYSYMRVKGKCLYRPQLVLDKCVLNYPVTGSIDINRYFEEIGSNISLPINIVKNFNLELTVSHGDLTVWNTFINNDDVIYIDLEYFKNKRVKYYDILYYIFSYNFFILKLNSIKNLQNLIEFITKNSINYQYLHVFFIELLYEKEMSLNDGFVYKERKLILLSIREIIKLL